MGKFRENNRNGGGFGRDRPSSGGGFGGGNRSFGGNRGGFGGSRGGFGGGRGRDRFSSEGPREMFDSICSKCGKKCQLPFRPRGDKPVYCSACFETEGQTSPRFEKSSKSSSSSGSPGVSQEQFRQLNTKLDKILAILSELELDDGEADETDLELEDEELEGDEDADSDDDDDFDDDEEVVVKK